MTDDEVRKQIQELNATLTQLMALIADVSVRVDAEHELAIAKKTYSREEYAPVVARLRERVKTAMATMAAEVLRNHQTERMRALLEDFEGEPH